jgi:DNA repair protein RadC
MYKIFLKKFILIELLFGYIKLISYLCYINDQSNRQIQIIYDMNSTSHFTNKVAEVQMSYRNPVKASERVKVTKSNDAYELIMASWDSTLELYESFKILMLNKANKVLGISTVGEGGVSSCNIDTKRVFTTALLTNCCSIILCHNHPSGNIQPSEADRLITKKIQSAGTLLDIAVLDHLIITPETYYSFADNGEI